MPAVKRKRPRSYDNRLRQEHAEQTRERILEALAEELGDVPLDELSVSGVARRAGVSEPTVYRHFPNRQAMLDAFVARWRAQPAGPRLTSLAELADQVPDVFAHFEANRRMVVAANRPHSIASKTDAPSRARRMRAFQELAAPAVAHLEPDAAAAITAIIRQVFSSRTWVSLVEEYGLSPEQAVTGVQWALRALLAELDRTRQDSKEE
jgi:AcrR family transcriptional regulator